MFGIGTATGRPVSDRTRARLYAGTHVICHSYNERYRERGVR